jgi:hypothetical protein
MSRNGMSARMNDRRVICESGGGVAGELCCAERVEKAANVRARDLPANEESVMRPLCHGWGPLVSGHKRIGGAA